MMNKMIKAAGAASLLALAVAGTTATADPLTSLYYQQSAGWGSGTASFTPGSSGYDGLFLNNLISTGVYGQALWKDVDTDTSFIDVTSFNTGNGETLSGSDNKIWEEGDLMVITELLHTNNSLTLASGGQTPAQLWVADAVAKLTIKTGDQATTLLVDPSSTTIRFAETRNRLVDTPPECATPSPLGTVCDDIFKVEVVDFDDIFFTYDGFKYAVSFQLFPGPSTNKGNPAGTTLVCDDAGCSDGLTVVDDVPAGEIWVFTPEYLPGTSSILVAASWRLVGEVRVPEPSVLALFGAGILGLGLAGRRRKQRHQQ